MPYEQPGSVHEAVATKQVVHGDPCVEDGFAGTAAKTAEPSRWTNPTAGGRRTVIVTEAFEVMLTGIHPIRQALFPGAALPAVGDKIYIRDVDNAVLVNDTSEGTDEVQTITNTATGGTGTITVDGETTSALAFGANSATIQAALDALSNVEPGDITAVRVGDVITLTFGGKWGDQDRPPVTVGVGSLTGGTWVVATATPGVGRTIHKLGLVERLSDPLDLAYVNYDQRGAF